MARVVREAKTKTKPTVAELEMILEADSDAPIEILPNGEVWQIVNGKRIQVYKEKVLTFRENLGGEYGELAA